MIRAPRAVTAALFATVILPFALCSCSTAAGAEEHAAQLHAAQDSNLLSVPAEQVYELSEFTVVTPTALAQLSDSSGAPLDYSGTMVLSDNIITEAEFGFAVAGLQSASFVLTEPTTLRRAENETGPAYAVGELTIGDQLPMPTMVKFTPTVFSEGELAFDIDIDLPGDLPFVQNSFFAQDFTAHIALTPVR